MSVSTVGYINSQIWRVDHVLEFISNVIADGEIKIHRHDSLAMSSMMAIIFKDADGNERDMYMHTDASTPLGRAYRISLGANNEGKKIIRKIVSAMGGLFIPSDCEEKAEMLYGYLWEEDKAPYFMRYGVVSGLITSRPTSEDIARVETAWKEKHGKGK